MAGDNAPTRHFVPPSKTFSSRNGKIVKLNWSAMKAMHSYICRCSGKDFQRSLLLVRFMREMLWTNKGSIIKPEKHFSKCDP